MCAFVCVCVFLYVFVCCVSVCVLLCKCVCCVYCIVTDKDLLQGYSSSFSPRRAATTES